MKTAIVTDSNSGISPKEAERLGVFVLPMPVIINGEVFYEGVDLTEAQFYQALSAQTVQTSQPSPEDVTDLWDRVLAEYDELVYIPMSSGLSSSCASAVVSALTSKYLRKVFVADNHRISATQRSSVLDACALAEAGCTAREIHAALEETAYDSIVYVGVDTLTFLRRGGRVTPAAAALSTILNFKPLLKIEGNLLEYYDKVRGASNCQKQLIETVQRTIRDYDPRWDLDIAAASSFISADDSASWHNHIVTSFPQREIICTSLPFSIGCHVGPNAFGMGISRRIARMKGELPYER